MHNLRQQLCHRTAAKGDTKHDCVFGCQLYAELQMAVSSAEHERHCHMHPELGYLYAYSQAEMNDWCVKAAGPAEIQTVRLDSIINGNDNINMMISTLTLPSTISFPHHDEPETCKSRQRRTCSALLNRGLH